MEQYATPAGIAAELVHTAALQGDLAGERVVDLGCGTGVLALGAATRGADRVIGVDCDPAALAIARENAARLAPDAPVEWLLADGSRPPIAGPVVVLANPPFGAQGRARHADRSFLAAAAAIATRSYTIHNAGSERFVRSFVTDRSGRVTHAWQATFTLDRQFPFHTSDRHEIDVEIYRIDWS